jgi:hypothetical protein
MTPRERGQRYRRKLERAKGKPRIGRPRGSRNVVSGFDEAMKLYIYLREHEHSDMAAGEAVRKLLGDTITEIMVQNWRARGLITGKKATGAPRKRNTTGRFLPDLRLNSKGENL